LGGDGFGRIARAESKTHPHPGLSSHAQRAFIVARANGSQALLFTPLKGKEKALNPLA
jgi:hypothetical protein